MTLSDIPAPSRYYICLWLVSLMRGGYERAYAKLRSEPLSSPEKHCASGVGCDLIAQDFPDYYEWKGKGIYPTGENPWDNTGSHVEPLPSIAALMGWKNHFPERRWNDHVEDFDETVAAFLRDKGDSPITTVCLASHVATTSDTGLSFTKMAQLMQRIYADELDFDLPPGLLAELPVNDNAFDAESHIESLGVEPHQSAYLACSHKQATTLA